MKSIETIEMKDVSIFNQDTNILAKNINHSLILYHNEKETITNFCHSARLCKFR